MKEDKKISFGGKIYEWDERRDAGVYRVNNRRVCVKHSWVNGYLVFSRPSDNGEWHIGLKGDNGSDCFRFCYRCKAIGCIHVWEPCQEDTDWKSCSHVWQGGLSRLENNNGGQWHCSECGAVWRFMCGCGGSLFVCDRHFTETVAHMEKEEGSITAYLNKNCQKPEHPKIETCKICKLRIRIW